jgi:hypothetical protein
MCRTQSRVASLLVLVHCACTAVLLSNAVTPGVAHGSCVAPTPKVIWSYPAADEVDVPLDADLLMVTESIWSDVHVTLDGEPLVAGSRFFGHFDLGTLQPSRTYTVAISSSQEHSEPAVDLEFRFTTGDAASGEEHPDVVTIQSASRRNFDFAEDLPCSDALLANSCFDTGAPSLESFETDADAVLWVVEVYQPDQPVGSYVRYPGECGQPRMLDYPAINGSRLYRVHAIQHDGSTTTSDPVPVPYDGDDSGDLDPDPGDAGAGGEPAGGAAGRGDSPSVPEGSAGAGASGGDATAVRRDDACAVSAPGAPSRGASGFALPCAVAAWASWRRRALRRAFVPTTLGTRPGKSGRSSIVR